MMKRFAIALAVAGLSLFAVNQAQAQHHGHHGHHGHHDHHYDHHHGHTAFSINLGGFGYSNYGIRPYYGGNYGYRPAYPGVIYRSAPVYVPAYRSYGYRSYRPSCGGGGIYIGW